MKNIQLSNNEAPSTEKKESGEGHHSRGAKLFTVLSMVPGNGCEDRHSKVLLYRCKTDGVFLHKAKIWKKRLQLLAQKGFSGLITGKLG